MIEQPPILTLRRSFPRPSEAQVEALRGVPTGFVCDAMDGQGALAAEIRAIGGGRDIDCRAVGTALVADNGPGEVLATMGALQILEPGDILVAAVHGHRNCAAAGDMVCGMMKNKGAAALVTDGEMRDYDGIVDVGLPAWCTGLTADSPSANGPGRAGFGAVLGGRRVESGDLIVADIDGVVVVPLAQIDAVIERLARVRELEEDLEAKVRAGLSEFPAVGDMIADGRAVVVD